MKAPSFFIESEDEGSLHMQYRTRRKGFHFYVQGQVVVFIYNHLYADVPNVMTMLARRLAHAGLPADRVVPYLPAVMVTASSRVHRIVLSRARWFQVGKTVLEIANSDES